MQFDTATFAAVWILRGATEVAYTVIVVGLLSGVAYGGRQNLCPAEVLHRSSMEVNQGDIAEVVRAGYCEEDEPDCANESGRFSLESG